MDTKKLRQKVLDLAIHGKLVKQDPNDEPASILLDRIRAEKARLVKEGKIKKTDLIEKPISEDEIPFEVPEGWEWLKVESFTYDLLYGTSTKSSSVGLVPVLRMGNITRIGTVDFSDLVYSSNKDDIEKYELKYNDLLFNRTNSSDWVGKTAIFKSNNPAIYAGYLIRVRCIGVLPDFINLAMNSSYHRNWCFQVKTDAVNQSNINAQKLSKHLIPLPPLAEQHRIVKAVDELFEQIDIIERSEKELEEAANKTRDKLLNLAIQGHLVPQDPNDEPASVLLERIRAEKARLVKEGKLKKKDLEEKPISLDEIPFDIPEGWAWCRLGDLVMINPRNQADDNLDAAFIPMAYIDPNLQNTFRYEVKQWGQIKSGFTHLQDNDVVFAKITPCITNRKAAIMHDLPNGIGGGTTELNVFRVYGETINRFYLLYYLASEYFLHKASYKGTAGQQRIETKYVVNKPFPLPPLSEQRRIVTKLEELLQEIDKLKA